MFYIGLFNASKDSINLLSDLYKTWGNSQTDLPLLLNTYNICLEEYSKLDFKQLELTEEEITVIYICIGYIKMYKECQSSDILKFIAYSIGEIVNMKYEVFQSIGTKARNNGIFI